MRRRKTFGRRKFRRGLRRVFRRTFKKSSKRRSFRATKAVNRNPSFFSDSTFVKLVYIFNAKGTSTGGVLQYRFALNDVWDPDLNSSNGKTAYGQEYWANFYHNFTVYGSKIDLQFISSNGSGTPTLQDTALDVVVRPTGNLSVGSDNTFNGLLSYATQKVMQLGWGYDSRQCRIKRYMSTAKIAGLPKKTITNDPNFSGTASNVTLGGSAPVNLQAWQICCQSENRVGTVDFRFNGKITYYVKFYARKDPAYTFIGGNDSNYTIQADVPIGATGSGNTGITGTAPVP